jgi:cytochrome b561
MSASFPRGYSALQICLHWAVALLVLFQLFFGESMTTVVEAAEEGGQASAQDQFLASAHHWAGWAILGLVILRLALRVSAGAPKAAGAADWMSRVATVSHWLFYALLIAMPVTGLLTYFGLADLGEVHALGKPVFIVLIVIHAAAAFFHAVFLKDGTLRRMLVPAK